MELYSITSHLQQRFYPHMAQADGGSRIPKQVLSIFSKDEIQWEDYYEDAKRF